MFFIYSKIRHLFKIGFYLQRKSILLCFKAHLYVYIAIYFFSVCDIASHKMYWHNKMHK